jgi:hypothetical protein
VPAQDADVHAQPVVVDLFVGLFARWWSVYEWVLVMQVVVGFELDGLDTRCWM